MRYVFWIACGLGGYLVGRYLRMPDNHDTAPMCQHIFCIKHATGRLNGRHLCGEHWRDEAMRSGIQH